MYSKRIEYVFVLKIWGRSKKHPQNVLTKNESISDDEKDDNTKQLTPRRAYCVYVTHIRHTSYY